MPKLRLLAYNEHKFFSKSYDTYTSTDNFDGNTETQTSPQGGFPKACHLPPPSQVITVNTLYKTVLVINTNNKSLDFAENFTILENMEQGLLYKTRCYLSGSMEFNTEGHLWRADVRGKLGPTGIIFLDPYEKPFMTSLPEDEGIRKHLKEQRRLGNYDVVHDYFKHVRSDDLRMCDMADFAIVRYSIKRASIGTDEEVVTLNRMKKPIFLFVDEGKKECPLWLLGMLKPRYIYNTVEEVIDTILSINNGTIKIDSTRWRLLKPELR